MLFVRRAVHIHARGLLRTHLRTLRTSPLPLLPEQSEWRTVFNPAQVGVRERISIRNPDTAALLAKNFLSWTKVKEPRIVIEAFPG